MKNKTGFTLIELLATISLLALLAVIIYPNVTEQIEKKKREVDQTKLELIYNETKDYILNNQNTNGYYLNVGDVYCVDLNSIDSSIDIDDVKKNYNYVEVKIGKDNNYSYNLVTDCEENK